MRAQQTSQPSNSSFQSTDTELATTSDDDLAIIVGGSEMTDAIVTLVNLLLGNAPPPVCPCGGLGPR